VEEEEEEAKERDEVWADVRRRRRKGGEEEEASAGASRQSLSITSISDVLIGGVNAAKKEMCVCVHVCVCTCVRVCVCVCVLNCFPVNVFISLSFVFVSQTNIHTMSLKINKHELNKSY